MNDDVLIYFKPGCPFRGNASLSSSAFPNRVPGAAFKSDPESASEVRAANSGNQISPTLRAGGQLLANPTVNQVRAALRSLA